MKEVGEIFENWKKMAKARLKYFNSYTPEDQKPDLKWYKRDGLLSCYGQLKYKEFSVNPEKWILDVHILTLIL